jgi:hypothetical protein
MISKTYGFEKFIADPSNLQAGIERARNARADQFVGMKERRDLELMEKELAEREKIERAM